MRFDGTGNDGAGANAGPGSDLALREYDSAHTDHCAFRHLDVAAKMCAGCNVGVVSDHVVVIHTAGSVQNDVVADAAACIDDDAGAEDGAGTEQGILCNDG